MPCNDRENHHAIAAQGVRGPRNCHANRRPCDRLHPNHVTQEYSVCDTCHLYTLRMLLLSPAATAHQLGAANVRQLSNGNALRQSGVSPPERLIAPFVARWQTLAERNTRMFLRGNSLDAPFGGFLTRVCNTCETNILQEICHMNANTIQHHPATTHRDWENWPRVSCTCKSKLGITNPPQERLCKRDRENVWTGLVEKKNLNDQWLRNIQLDGRYRNPKLIEATTATKRDRVWSGPGVGQPNRGFWRVCRCGKEVAPVVRPNVYICMACEGWVSLPNAPINPNRLSLKEVSRLRRQFNTTYKLRRTLPDLGLPQ